MASSLETIDVGSLRLHPRDPTLTVHLGLWRLPLPVVAWAGSLLIHGGLLTASYLSSWAPTPISQPRILLSKGERAQRVTITILTQPYPPASDTTASTRRSVTGSIATQLSPPPVPETQEVVVQPAAKPVGKIPVMDLNDRLNVDEPTPLSCPLVEESKPIEEQKRNVSTYDSTAVDDRNASSKTPIHKEPPKPKETQAVVVQSIRKNKARSDGRPAVEVDRKPDATHKQFVHGQAVQAVKPKPDRKGKVDPSTAKPAGVETGVKIVNLPAPTYPSLSRRRGEQGVVLLRVVILPDASIGSITVLRDPGFPRLKQAAIAAVRHARFEPATRDGHAVQAVVRIPFRFVLR